MRALSGLRVIDGSRDLAGGLVATLLADQGADVRSCGRALRCSARIDEVPPDLSGIDVLIVDRPDAVPDAVPESLVLTFVPAFPEGDPFHHRAVPEGIVGAAGALYEVPLGRRPVYTPMPVASVIAAEYAAVGTIAALLARRRDGSGQRVTVPRYDALFAVHELAALLTADPPRIWTTLQWAASPALGAWPCADGRWIYVHLGLSHHLSRFLEALELDWPIGAATRADPSAPGGVLEAWTLHRRLAALFRTRPAAHWEQVLSRGGLCAAMCRTTAEWVTHPHARESGAVLHTDDGVLPGPLVGVSGERAPWTPSDAGPPLAGLRVLDLTQVIAGPVAARTLSELGADVLRLENPHFRPAWGEAFHVAFNPGKRSAWLDLRGPDGETALEEVIRAHRPDVIVENFRPGVAERLGLDAHDALLVSLTAYGRTGPWGSRPGWEQTAQAATGIQVRTGGEGPPELFAAPVNDLGTGLAAAFATLCAVWGGGARAEASLTATATWLQVGLLDGERPHDALGEGPSHRFHRFRDGWAFVAAPDGIRLDPEALARETVQECEARLGPDVAIHPRVKLADLLQDPDARERGRVVVREQPGIGTITETRSPLQLSRTPIRELEPARERGADTGSVVPGAPEPPELPARSGGSVRWITAQLRWGLLLALRRASLRAGGPRDAAAAPEGG